jgi:hypothetical protein
VAAVRCQLRSVRSTHFATSQRRPPIRLMTLDWPQFAALVVCLLAIAIVLAVILKGDLVETFHRLDLRQYEQKLGFHMGLVKGFPMGPPEGIWGITHVTVGGTMDRAGMRSGDILFNYHLYGATELSWAIREAAKGKTACVPAMSVDEARAGAGREICFNGK